MTTFKEIRGQLIRSVSSDPANPQLGEIWYNNTIGVLKGYTTIAAAWASGGNLNNTKDGLAGAGTQTAGLAFGGEDTTPAPSKLTETEEYNGTSWSEQSDLSTARKVPGGLGTQTAALAFGGFNDPGVTILSSSEEYNGSSWTSGGNLGTGRYNITGTGTQTAGLGIGGSPPSADGLVNVENIMELLGQVEEIYL